MPPKYDPEIEAAFADTANTGPIRIPKAALPTRYDPEIEAAYGGAGGSGKYDPEIEAAYAKPAAPVAKEPSPLLFAKPRPEDPSVQAQVKKRGERELSPLMSIVNGGLEKDVLLDAFSGGLLGETPNFLGRDLKGLASYGQAKGQMAGVTPAKPMPATEDTGTPGERLDFPAWLQRYGVSGLRPPGAALTEFAEGLRRRIENERPDLSDEQVHKAMWRDSFLTTAAKRPDLTARALRAGADTLKMGPGGVFDPNVPSLIDAPGKIVAKYGTEAKSPRERGTAWETAMNFAKALTEVPGGIMAAHVENVKSLQPELREPGWQPKPLSQALTTVGPETPEDLSTKTAPGPLGARITPAQANTMGFAASFLPGADALPLAAKAAGLVPKAIGGVARAGARGLEAVAPGAVKAVNQAGERAVSAVRLNPVVDTLGATFGGAPWDAKQAVLQAERAQQSLPTALRRGSPLPPALHQEVGQAVTRIPYEQNLGTRRVMERARDMNVAPEHWEAFSNALEHPDPAVRKAALATLTPEEQLAAATYEHEARLQDIARVTLMGSKSRDDYMAHVLTPEMQQRMPKAPARPPGAAGVGVRFNKERSFPEVLSAEAGRPITSAAEVNQYINDELLKASTRGGGGLPPVVENLAEKLTLSPNEPVFNLNPRQNFVDRFVPGALQNARAEAYAKMRPLALPMTDEAIPGYVPTKEGSILRKAGGEQLPAAAVRMAERTEKAPITWGEHPIRKALGAPVQAWKQAVTTLGGPGYHARNLAYSVQKRLSEFNPGEVARQELGFRRLDSGSNESWYGVGMGDIRAAGEKAGTWGGTGAGPTPNIRTARVEAGLEKATPLPLRPVEKLREGAGNLAQVTDEGQRMRVILGQLERNQGKGTPAERLADAVAFARTFIVHTGEKSPALEAASQVWPFVGWNTREVPDALKRFAGGRSPVAPRLTALAEANTDQTDQVPEKYRPRRAREGSAMPTGARGETGLPRYMLNPGTPIGPIAQFADPLYELAQAARGKAGAGDVAKSVMNVGANNALPPLGWALAEASGVRPLTKTTLDTPQKATAPQTLFANVFPDRAKEMGLIQAQDGQWYTTGHGAMFTGAMPWSAPMRAAAAKTPAETERALLGWGGLNFVHIDPSLADLQERISREEEKKLTARRLTTIGGLPQKLLHR